MVITLPLPTGWPHWLAASSAATWLSARDRRGDRVELVGGARRAELGGDGRCCAARAAALGVPSASAWSTVYRSGQHLPAHLVVEVDQRLQRADGGEQLLAGGDGGGVVVAGDLAGSAGPRALPRCQRRGWRRPPPRPGAGPWPAPPAAHPPTAAAAASLACWAVTTAVRCWAMKPARRLISALIAAGLVAALSWARPACRPRPRRRRSARRTAGRRSRSIGRSPPGPGCAARPAPRSMRTGVWARSRSSRAGPSSLNQPATTTPRSAPGCSSARSGARLDAGTPAAWSRSHWARSCGGGALKLLWRSLAAWAVTPPAATMQRRSGGIR